MDAHPSNFIHGHYVPAYYDFLFYVYSVFRYQVLYISHFLFNLFKLKKNSSHMDFHVLGNLLIFFSPA